LGSHAETSWSGKKTQNLAVPNSNRTKIITKMKNIQARAEAAPRWNVLKRTE
jgi:hypothetical protein